MKSFFLNLGAEVKNLANAFWALPKRKRALVALVLLVISILPFFSGDEKDEVATSENVRTVTLESVAQLSSLPTTLSLFGTVTSKSEATIRAESGGKIVAVYKKLGDYAVAGEVIGEFENSAERAQLLSAEGAYESAKLGKDIAGINIGTSASSLAEAKTQALNTISSAYVGIDDAVRTKTDTAWKNPETRSAKLTPTISDAKLVITLETQRAEIYLMMRAREEKNQTLSQESNLVAELTLVEAETNLVKEYLDNLSLAFNRALADNNASQASIDGWKASTAGARSSVGGILSSITATRNALNGSIAANKIAEKTSINSTGESASSADAQVKSALGNLRGAQARLEKTIIRSPISGTLNSLSISTGDFVSPYTEVAVVSNNGALEILAYVTEEDARKLTAQSKVTIESGATGVITRIAPAIDPKTKKIEVRIGIVSGTKLINGQSVRVEVMQAEKVANISTIKIPLSALKITPNGMIAFTVSDAGLLVPHSVKQGTLLGSDVVILDGLTLDMRIVTDARGLQEGMAVNVK